MVMVMMFVVVDIEVVIDVGLLVLLVFYDVVVEVK